MEYNIMRFHESAALDWYQKIIFIASYNVENGDSMQGVRRDVNSRHVKLYGFNTVW